MEGRLLVKGGQHSRKLMSPIVPLIVLAFTLLVPCAAALLSGLNWFASARAISGVLSLSAGVSLVPLQTETGYDALRWV